MTGSFRLCHLAAYGVPKWHTHLYFQPLIGHPKVASAQLFSEREVATLPLVFRLVIDWPDQVKVQDAENRVGPREQQVVQELDSAKSAGSGEMSACQNATVHALIARPAQAFYRLVTACRAGFV